MEYTYTMDQLRDTAENGILRFECYEQAQQHGGVKPGNYFMADYGVIEAQDPVDACEKLYRRYNYGPRPEGYTGRSMSVSDVVNLWDNSTDPPVKSAWYCDSVGFRRLE